MREGLQFISKYVYNNRTALKMGTAHVLQLALSTSRVMLPQLAFTIFEALQAGEIPGVGLAAVLGVFALNTLLPKLQNSLIDAVRFDMQKQVTLDMVDQIFQRELDTLQGTMTGKPAVIASKNYGTVADVLPTLNKGIIPACLETIGISAVLASWLGPIGLVPAVILGTSLFASHVLERRTEHLKAHNSLLKVTGFTGLMTAINNYQIAHQFGNTRHELKQLEGKLTELGGSYKSIEDEANRNTLKLSLLSRIPLLAVMAYTLYVNFQVPGFLVSKEFLLSTYYLLRASSLIESLPEKIQMFYTGLVDVAMIAGFHNQKTTTFDPVNPVNFRLISAPSIEFRNVSFGYKDGGSAGLNDISFTIRPGQRVVIMGETGSGKSTILKLLQRFYEFNGDIRINDVSVRDVLKDQLRAGMAVVSQETGLIPCITLHDNIEYGHLSTRHDDRRDEVMRAAEFAALDVDRERFFRMVKQQGSDFSGGEKQRINIARFLLKAPHAQIFLLDEPTSALDQQTAQKVSAVLDQLSTRGTTITVTHDPALAASSDFILYLDKGRIVEQGSFAELMVRKGLFYDQICAQCRKLGLDVNLIQLLKQAAIDSNNEFLSWQESCASI